MASPLSGVTSDTIGVSYDVALGYDTGSTIKMVGYVLQPGTKWTEATDIQDEQHLVQISSLNATDRFTRYPKVSQGDWSGGERQAFFDDPKKYFSSDGSINPTVPGQLQLLANRVTQAFTSVDPTGRNHSPICSDGSFLYVGHATDATHNLLSSNANSVSGTTFTSQTVGDGSRLLDLLGDSVFNANGCYAALTNGGGATNGILQINATGGTVAQMTNDAVVATAVPAMCSLNANLFYATAGNIRFVPFATPAGNLAGTAYFAIPANEGICTSIFSTGSQMVFTTEAGPTAVAIGNQTVIWQADGTNVPSRLGVIPGRVRGGGQVNGIVYLVVGLSNNFTPFGPNVSSLPDGIAIYQVDGTVVSVFDDYRSLDPSFQLFAAVINTAVACSCVGDGRFMYVSIPGLPVRAYDLNTQGNPVFQYGPSAAAFGVSLISHRLFNPINSNFTSPISVIFDLAASTTTLSQIAGTIANSGTITLSWMDFGAPGTVKSFRKVEVELAAAMPAGASITVGFALDDQTTFTSIPLTANAQGNLVGFFPYPTKGYRTQLRATLTSAIVGALPQSPVVRSISVKATLGRTWKCTVSCARNQRLRNQYSAGDDQQGLRAQDKLANIQNAYQLVAGGVTVFVPSPTKTGGVEQVQATIEDYTWTASAEPGPYNTEYGSLDMEGTVDLTLVESL